ncbi:hypothetical protein DL96DRAFT_1720168 [Flagelloscypha sp. PMI_526]|nr:hypothetical protein DL96DRAFT_1720168 [Flagelloscypha sp. PMI_526]
MGEKSLKAAENQLLINSVSLGILALVYEFGGVGKGAYARGRQNCYAIEASVSRLPSDIPLNRHIGLDPSWKTHFTASGFTEEKFSSFTPEKVTICFHTSFPLELGQVQPLSRVSSSFLQTTSLILVKTSIQARRHLALRHATTPAHGISGGGNAPPYLGEPGRGVPCVPHHPSLACSQMYYDVQIRMNDSPITPRTPQRSVQLSLSSGTFESNISFPSLLGNEPVPRASTLLRPLRHHPTVPLPFFHLDLIVAHPRSTQGETALDWD